MTDLDAVLLGGIELEILTCLADGLQSKEIAGRIARSVPTVEFYVRSLYLKLNARSRAHLVAEGFRRGYLAVTPPERVLLHAI